MDDWKSSGLTDRLSIPGSKGAPCWEDLSARYSWQLDDSSPLHSAWSSNEFLPRASDKDGTLLPVFEAVWPEAAADVPVVAAPSKTIAGAKRSSSKGGRGNKKGGKGGKVPFLPDCLAFAGSRWLMLAPGEPRLICPCCLHACGFVALPSDCHRA